MHQMEGEDSVQVQGYRHRLGQIKTPALLRELLGKERKGVNSMDLEEPERE